MKRNIILIIAEILVMGGIIFGWSAPLLFPSEEVSLQPDNINSHLRL